MTDRLESDGPELQVLRFIYLAHSASADRTNDAETPKDKLAWLKASGVVIQEPVKMGEWSVRRAGVLLFGPEKLFEVHLEFEIPAARSLDKYRTILCVLLQRGMKQRFEALPEFGSHIDLSC
jgi:hypothetical protein